MAVPKNGVPEFLLQRPVDAASLVLRQPFLTFCFLHVPFSLFIFLATYSFIAPLARANMPAARRAV